jgi:hypothetical protein
MFSCFQSDISDFRSETSFFRLEFSVVRAFCSSILQKFLASFLSSSGCVKLRVPFLSREMSFESEITSSA